MRQLVDEADIIERLRQRLGSIARVEVFESKQLSIKETVQRFAEATVYC